VAVPTPRFPETAKISGESVSVTDYQKANRELAREAEAARIKATKEAIQSGGQPKQKMPDMPDTVVAGEGANRARISTEHYHRYQAEERDKAAKEKDKAEYARARQFLSGKPAPSAMGGLLEKLGPQLGGSIGQMANMAGNVMGAGGLSGLAGAIGGGAAGAAGGGMAGLAAGAAGGPIGVAVAAGKMAVDTFAGSLNKAARGVEQVGKVQAEWAKNDYLSGFMRGVDGMSETMEEIPIVGSLYSAQMKLAMAPLKAGIEITQAYLQRAKELSMYSGQLTGAEVRGEIREMKADIREARALEDGLTRMSDSTSRLQSEMRELLLPIKNFVVNELAWRLQAIAEVVSVIRGWRDAHEILMKSYTQAIIEAIQLHFDKAGEILEKGFTDAKKAFEGEGEDLNDMSEAFFADLQRAMPIQGR